MKLKYKLLTILILFFSFVVLDNSSCFATSTAPTSELLSTMQTDAENYINASEGIFNSYLIWAYHGTNNSGTSYDYYLVMLYDSSKQKPFKVNTENNNTVSSYTPCLQCEGTGTFYFSYAIYKYTGNRKVVDFSTSSILNTEYPYLNYVFKETMYPRHLF